MASVAGNSAAIASVVFKPLPVMQTTVVSSGLMRFWALSFLVTPTVTPPAVSVKMPSVSASSLMASTISGSDTSSAQPPESRISFIANGPSAGLPMASERAMVFGFCGSNRARLRFTPSEIGEHPVACAPKNFTGLSFTQPNVTNSLKAFAIFVISEPARGSQRRADHAVFERERREAHRVVLQVEIFDAPLRSQLVRQNQRCASRGRGWSKAFAERQQLGIAPHVERARRKIFAARDFLQRVVIVGNFERREAVFAKRPGHVAPGFAAFAAT